MVLTTTLFICQGLFSQSNHAFCKAVAHANFSKAERIFKRQVKKYANVYPYSSKDSGRVIKTAYEDNNTAIINWLKKQEGVADAFWDKCQAKPAIYPGYTSIGVKFKTKDGIAEKCFLIQEGTTGQVNILGWKPKLFKSKPTLVYRKMFNCDNFIEQQKKNCDSIQ